MVLSWILIQNHWGQNSTCKDQTTRIPAPAKTSLMRFPWPYHQKYFRYQPHASLICRCCWGIYYFPRLRHLSHLNIWPDGCKPSSPFPRIWANPVEFLVPWAKLIPSAKLLWPRAFSTTRPSVYYISRLVVVSNPHTDFKCWTQMSWIFRISISVPWNSLVLRILIITRRQVRIHVKIAQLNAITIMTEDTPPP